MNTLKGKAKGLILALFAAGSLNAQDAAKTVIGISVELGPGYASLLGQAESNEASSLAIQQLEQVLDDRIRYFEFAPAEDSQPYRLHFKLDHPSGGGSASQNLHDYYAFVTLFEGTEALSEAEHWLFREAGDSLTGAESATTLADRLSQQVRESQHKLLASKLLHEVSFTNQAQLNPLGNRAAWLIAHSANALCLSKRSVLRIHSLVPGAGYEDEFEAVVKGHPNDNQTTFTLATQGDVAALIDNPEQATVVAVHVLEYRRRCNSERVIAQTSPSQVSFDGGSQ